MEARLAKPEAAPVGAFDGQLALKIPAERLTEAVEPEGAEHGAVFTRRWVVELILDLAGYTADRPLDRLRAIEPACGHGAFLAPMAARLSETCRRSGKSLREAEGAIRAFDLQPDSVALSRQAVAKTLIDARWSAAEARHFAESSVHHGDFLLQEHAFSDADFVLGNPPYIRLEAVSPARSDAYRRACRTMAGRADIYVGFIEVGLKALREEGTLAFICADRWMRNQYGRLLRDLVANHFSFEAAIEMHDVDAFAEEVSAYPSIVVIRNREQHPVLVAETQGDFSARDAASLAKWRDSASQGEERQGRAFRAALLNDWFQESRPWPSGSPARLAALRDLEQRLPALEDAETGTRVGIGVATGADRVFVTAEKAVAEADRMLPLAMAADTMSGELEWSGHYLANPWRDDGEGLVDLDEFPQLSRYYHAKLLEEVFLDAGFPAESISRRSRLELPGYFRPTKKWDLVVVHDGQLAAAIELKSHVGPSFGNNFNNRIEEATGSATDIWTAFREGRLGKTRPWLGYLLMLEEHPKSTSPVGVKEPFFPVEDVFRGASYKERYELLCRRLVLERLYDAACFVTSSASPRSPIHEPAEDLSVEHFIRQIRGRAAQLIEVDR